MLTKPRYSPWDMFVWTRRELAVFTTYALLVAAAYLEFQFDFLRVPWAPIGVLGTAVAFIIGFQNNSAYERIWEARKIWGAILNVSRTFGVYAMDMVGGARADRAVPEEELRGHRKQLLHRQIAWLTALRHEMRQPRAWEEFDNHRTNREWSDAIHIPERTYTIAEEIGDLLTSDESAEACGRNNTPAAILAQHSRHLAELERAGLLWEFSHLEMQSLVKEMITLQGQSERIKNFPYPRQYATLSYQFVRLFVFLLPFAVVPAFAQVGESLTGPLPLATTIFPWMSVPFCVLVSWVFHTMERIGRVGENPFEGSANDVPISTISRTVEIDLRQMLGEPDEALPDPVPSARDVQM